MKLLFTKQAITSLRESIFFLEKKVSEKQIRIIISRIFERCDDLLENPESGSKEEYLEHLGLGHRRLIVGHFKVIYRIQGKIIFITDIFDSRQNPVKMKG